MGTPMPWSPTPWRRTGSSSVKAHGLLVGFAALVLTTGDLKASAVADVVTYGCNELVVVGRLRTLDYSEAPAEGELLQRGRYSMQASVKRVLRGKDSRRVLPVIGHAHGQMRDDVDFWLVLTPAPNGAYTLRAANLTSIPYRLAPKCESVSE